MPELGGLDPAGSGAGDEGSGVGSWAPAWSVERP